MSEAEFWRLTPYEYTLLLDRYRLDGHWQEAMAAVQPYLYAEAHRDEKKQGQPFTLQGMTLTGLAKAARRAERARKKALNPEQVWSTIEGMMKAFGGS